MKKLFIGLGVAILVIITGSLFGYQYVMAEIDGKAAAETFHMTIERGASLKDVLTELKRHGLIDHTFFRYWYMRIKQPDYTFQAGEYRIEKGLSIDQALDKFKRGGVVEEQTVRVTIPEGWNVKQIAKRLAAKKLVDEKRLLTLLADPSFYEMKRKAYPFLPPPPKDVKFLLEGYLFPETYTFPVNLSEEDVIHRMLEETKKVVDDLVVKYPELKQKPGEVFTLASIVEEETSVASERSRVAGVFFNRLDKGMKLQSDATVQYVLGKQHDRVLYKHLEIDDPYNTYRYKGLPPGPIASPGRTSLEATLKPEKHDYLYFVTKKDGSQTHYFAKTLKQHQTNDAKSRKTARQME